MKFGSSLYSLEIIVLFDWLLADLELSNFSHTIRSSKYIYQIHLDQVLLNFFCSVSGGAGVSGAGPGYSEKSGYSGPAAGYSGHLSFTIYTIGGVGVKRFQVIFHCRRRPHPSPLPLSRPRGDSTLPTIKNSSIFEGRLSSPPETPGRPWIWSSRALNGLKGILNFGSPDLPMP